MQSELLHFGSVSDYENSNNMLTDGMKKIEVVSPRMGVALARFYISMFQLLKRLAIFFGTFTITVGKVMLVAYSFVTEYLGEYINMSKFLGMISALFSIVSGLLWFVSASLQQALTGAETTEEVVTAFANTMEWQTYAGLTATIAAFLALWAVVLAKE